MGEKQVKSTTKIVSKLLNEVKYKKSHLSIREQYISDFSLNSNSKSEEF